MLPVGATVQDAYGSQYCIEKLLGKGGFGAVYLVSERDNKQRVFALKEVIDPSRQDRKRLLFERKVLRNLSNQALPRVDSVFESEDHRRVYLLMEYISGKDLEVLRKEQPEKRFPVATILEILAPIVDALIYLHQTSKGFSVEKLAERTALTFHREKRLPALPESERKTQREIGIGAQILSDLNLRRIRLLTNHPRKVAGLEGFNIEIVEQIPVALDRTRVKP